MKRVVQVERKTKETEIVCKLDVDGTGKSRINTGIGFMDHMLELMVFYSRMDMTLQVHGDLTVDSHHTIEDIGLVMGQCFKKVLGDKRGIARYGECLMPMDETLARVVMDFSGRPYLVYTCDFRRMDLGTLDVQNIKEFFKSVVNESGMTLHMSVIYGDNDHHMAEALFKGFGKCIKTAVALTGSEVFSTKGVLS